MIWVSWRRQRTETLIAAAFLVMLAMLLVPTGLEMAHAYHRDGLSGCVAQNVGDSCGDAVSSFLSRFESLDNLIAWLTLVPGLLGVLLAAPFVLEFEQGTHRLAWTQSVPRGRWIAGKLGLAVVVAVVAALSFTLLLTWWRTPFVHLQGRMQQSSFDSEGIVVLGYTLFALGLAAAIGVFWRRAVAAVLVAFAGYFAARIFVDTWLRQRLTSPLTAMWNLVGHDPRALRGAWVLDQHPSDRYGHAVEVPADLCGAGRLLKRTPGLGDCLARHGYFMHATYVPASRFWELQLVETSLFAGAGLSLLALAALWTYRRAA